MTTKTIPEYLEDERREDTDIQRRKEEEAVRNLALHHGKHRTPKPPRPELPALKPWSTREKLAWPKRERLSWRKRENLLRQLGKSLPACE
jgi:hypothetical protein